MREERRDSLHRQREPMVRFGLGDQRCRRWRCDGSVDQRRLWTLDSDEPQLGPELAIQCQLGRQELVLHCHHQRWQTSRVYKRRSIQLVFRSNIRRLSVLNLAHISSTQRMAPAIKYADDKQTIFT